MLGIFFVDHCSDLFHRSKYLMYLCQKCCRRWNENFCELLLEENLLINKAKDFGFGESRVFICICGISHPDAGIGDSEPRCVAGTEELPEHHKPPQGHHFVLKRIWCCLCSKPAGAQGFPGVTRAGYTNPGTDPHCTQWGQQELSLPVKK